MASETPVGLVIRRARERKGMTQEQVAEALRVNRVTVAHWESGKHFPLRKAGAIEELLGITIPVPEKVPA